MGRDFFRRAEWLHERRVVGYLRLVAILNLATLAFILVTASQGIDRNGFLLGTDFLSFWTAGQMLHAGGDVYDASAHIAFQRAYFAQDGVYTAFFYPPPFLLLCWPLGLFAYFPALALWVLTTGGLYVLAVRTWARELSQSLPLWTTIAAFPPVLITVTHGQTSFLASSLLAMGTLRVIDRPWAGGVLLGLAAIKPQFGMLIPILLLATGQWRAIAAAVLAGAAMAIAATALDADAWPRWLAAAEAAQAAMAQGAVSFGKMQSLFAAARLLGAPISLAYALQAALTLAVAGAVAGLAWRRGYDVGLISLTLTGALLATPFVLDYDLVLLAFPLIWLTGQRPGRWGQLVVGLAFIAGAFARPLATEAGIPIMPPVLLAVFALILQRLLALPPTPDRRFARQPVPSP